MTGILKTKASSSALDRARVVALLALIIGLAGGVSAPAAFVNFEAKQTHPLCLSEDGTKLYAVNTPDSRLSVFDVTHPDNPVLIAEIPVGLAPVSVQARTEDEVWVVNEVSDSVSIVSVGRRLVLKTLQVKDEPADVVFARGRAFVSAARRNEIAVFDVSNHTRIATIPLQGENPRALALSPAGDRVYVAFALSGNGTTIVPSALAPAQPAPNVITNEPPQVSLIVAATNPAWAGVIQYSMPDHDVAEIDATGTNVLRYYSRLGTVNLDLVVHPQHGNFYLANTDARNLVSFEPVLRGHIVDNRITCVTTNGRVSFYDLNPGVDYGLLPNPQAQSNALAQPTGIAIDVPGERIYVAAFGSDRVACLDTNGVILARIEVGPTTGAEADSAHKRGPRGLALNAAQHRLYVLNRIANTLSVINTSNHTVIVEMPLGSHDPTPARIRAGRGFLYDARLSGNGTVSCASCHVDGEMDMIAWDLGDPDGQMTTVITLIAGQPVPIEMHPMKGAMVTQTLRGLDGQDPLHWRGDRADFLAFNPAFDALLGGAQISNADMEAYRDFVETIVFHPNPNQNLDRSLPASLDGANPVAGRNTFLNVPYNTDLIPLTCNTCHSAPPGSGSNGIIIPGGAMRTSQSAKVAHLRNVYKKLNFDRRPGAESIGGFGFIHDGSVSTLTEFLSLPVFGPFATDTTIQSNLTAFMKCFDTGTAPAVGYSLTFDSNCVGQVALSNQWTVLEAQAAVSNIDLVVKGILQGQTRSLRYDPASSAYVADVSGVGPFSRTDLATFAQGQDVLTAMGVPPGSAGRMGTDRNENGILDGDESRPDLYITSSAGGFLTSWPTNDAAYVLEWTDGLSSDVWETVTQPRVLSGGRVAVSNAVSHDTRFFRLRRPW
jgi:YVTN family beta-propeller protein